MCADLHDRYVHAIAGYAMLLTCNVPWLTAACKLLTSVDNQPPAAPGSQDDADH